ncbi:hypothetical protein [Brevifollis gellanilyticus]|uniref:Uncharacterized protein n=1 Tax=Brevifollis gellanilyticus TaxID=748831 RepID=A0A512MG23_9BACT|nr:hypothetical protein [Brevifollis gellanilyticus]GEP45684.1 hypothetical protein BGE01nite_49750 [Brevifollis gellanilyticus]
MPVSKHSCITIKAEALRLVSALPETATWDDLMHQIYVRQKIEAGLDDLKSGRKHKHQSIRQTFGLG